MMMMIMNVKSVAQTNRRLVARCRRAPAASARGPMGCGPRAARPTCASVGRARAAHWARVADDKQLTTERVGRMRRAGPRGSRFPRYDWPSLVPGARFVRARGARARWPIVCLARCCAHALAPIT